MHLSAPYVRWMLVVVHYCLSILFILRFLRGVGDDVYPSDCIEPNQSDWFGGNTCLLKGYFGFPA